MRPCRGAPPRCRRAGTLHIGGTFEEIADSERAAWDGRVHDRPYVLLVQPTVCDPSRAPAGKHTLWGILPRAATGRRPT